ncbi:MAG: membrane protein insertion efficiency factor YidD, partial [Candidatus Amesbacteria bacterium]|nr:membrane protein insertion efficiency factor YidD [Candidatus Amesbacteria bacterium]
RFQPRCSDYTYQAIEKYGILLGIFKGFFRILKCNPLFKGGFDPI